MTWHSTGSKRWRQAVDIPVFGGGNIKRMEDVKKLIYARAVRRYF
ncbi:MAG: hypothetical protein ACLTSZ_06630 [Lachnospiraceae bacterium]